MTGFQIMYMTEIVQVGEGDGARRNHRYSIYSRIKARLHSGGRIGNMI
jgi:hypothetical protein